MNKTARKTVSISKKSYDSLLEYFDNNHQVGQFLTYLIEQTVLKLEENKTIVIEIDITKF